MAASPEKISRISARSSYISTVIGISLVLFMLGCLGFILVNAKKLSQHVKENIQVQVFLKENTDEKDVLRVKKVIEAETFVKRSEFISQAKAAKSLEEEIGEDFVSYLGYNPLPPSIEVFLHSDYASPDSLQWIEQELKRNAFVTEVDYSPDLLETVNANINSITLVFLGFSILLLLISIALINNTIRLAIFSKRFLIKTMKLVGATPSFIRKPFVWSGIVQGLLASFIAIAIIIALLISFKEQLPEFFELQDLISFGVVFAGITVMGIIISWLSTHLAVRRYIKLKNDDVY
ncbi:cell division protein FtsX [Luteibaculum oceani]|uniref:Cell division protein FtsX n=1 Tax=Luteibaculum oceani TaxID=1294296 RepID=A0A5C6VNI7_9FLAO|nr:permease-like cell division protein FtsX [Luteibaculum oceani]TXC85105.1 FtsX-like permease family protein [Luteibaculum oceani]